MDIRRLLVISDTVKFEGGAAAVAPVTRVAACAVIAQAETIGWFAMIPTAWPPRRARPVTIMRAKSGLISKKLFLSTTPRMSSFMSYGSRGFSGMMLASRSSIRSAGASQASRSG